MWLYALAVIGRHIPRYREMGMIWFIRSMTPFSYPGAA
jgi:hypothetical protein